MDNKEFVLEISKLRPGSQFLVLHKYQNEAGEIADFNIIFNMSYENALKRSIKIVEAFKPAGELQRAAQLEVLDSYQRSLHSVQNTPLDEVDDAYYRYRNEDGGFIEGIKLHVESNILHLFGLVHLKKVITPGNYKTVNSRPLTIEKRKIQSLCPVSKYRQFRLHPSQVERIAVQKMTLLPPVEENEVG